MDTFLNETLARLNYVDQIDFIWAWISFLAFAGFYASFQWSRKNVRSLRVYLDEFFTSIFGAPTVLILVSELTGVYKGPDFEWAFWMSLATGGGTYPLAMLLIWTGFKVINAAKSRITKILGNGKSKKPDAK